jgi:hypothetical protein
MRRAVLPWLPSTLALAAASAVVAILFGVQAGSLPASGAALLVVAVPTLLAPLFWPRIENSWRRLLACALNPLPVIALIAACWWIARDVPLSLPGLALAGLVAVSVLAVAHQGAALIEGVLRRFGASASTAREWSYWTATTTLWLAAAAPLWLGPVADLGARIDPATPTMIFGASPLAHLAAAAGHDLLRGPWFYGHSSLGALQVEYPRVALLLVGYASAGVLLTLLAIPFGSPPADTAAVDSSIT